MVKGWVRAGIIFNGTNVFIWDFLGMGTWGTGNYTFYDGYGGEIYNTTFYNEYGGEQIGGKGVQNIVLMKLRDIT